MNAYRTLLLRSAKKWGSDDPDDADLFRKPIETFIFRAGNRPSSIKLFSFNDFWGYCLTVNCKTLCWAYGPFLKFCDPYQTRCMALDAAVSAIEEGIAKRDQVADRVGREVIAWSKGLLPSKQLSLFEIRVN